MQPTETVCPACGYDFPSHLQNVSTPSGFEYSSLADLALVISTIAAVIGACGALLGAVVAILQGQLLQGLLLCPIAFFIQLGLVVVFLRVQR
jgi:hypothetical protein